MESHLLRDGVWGWKDPQASTLLPFVREGFRRLDLEPAVVVCVRNPLHVAESQAKRQGSPKLQTIGAWMLSTLSALLDSSGLRRRVVLYESLLLEPKTMLEPIAEVLGISGSQETWAAIDSHIRPALSHGGAITEDDFSQLPSLVTQIYDLCKRMANDPIRVDQGDFDLEIESLWATWNTWHDLLERSEIGEVSYSLSWPSGGEVKIQEVKYRPTKGWQTVSCPCSAVQGTRIAVQLFPLPALVWIRKATWKHGLGVIPSRLQPGRHGQLDEFQGIQRVWTFHGPEQTWCLAPPSSEKLELELEVLIEYGNLITGLTIQDMSRRLSP
jgi:hypothetical protein